MADIKTPVLIIGAGLAGLTAATLLAWRGVPCVLAERRPSTSRHPRARGVNLRSLELLRQIPGLEADLRAAGRQGFEGFSMVIGETVTGTPVRDLVPGGFDTSRLSPAPFVTAGQDRIEPVLLKHARALGADIRFSTEVVDLVQDANEVRATLRGREGGPETKVSASYVIAADGTRGGTRQRLGIGATGRGTFSHNMSIIFDADLSFLANRFVLYYLQNKSFAGVFVTTDEPNRGQISVEYDPGQESAADYTPARCALMVRAALGLPDHEVKVLDAMPWEMASRIATRLRAGRVFLAGDAAHQMPPTGGLGGQTAMQDAADLAWKLALVLRGQADAALLDTYEAERLPVARLTVARQTEHYVERMRPDRTDLADANVERDYAAVAFGYRYRSAAIQDDPSDAGAPVDNPMQPSFRPGTRLGHGNLVRDGETISTLDLVGPDFVLLAGPGGAAWVAAAGALAARGLPVVGCRLGDELADPENFAERAGLAGGGALLVRPDGFIAWRFDGAHAQPDLALERALSRALCRAAPSLRQAA